MARWPAAANFIAFASVGLTSVGGYLGDGETGLSLFGQLDCAKIGEDFLAAAYWLKSCPDSTSKRGTFGFCFGGGIVNQPGVRMGPDLAAGVPIYGAQFSAADTAEIKAAINAQYGELHAYHRRMANLQCRPDAGAGAARGSYIHRRQSWVPQRHDSR